MSDFQRYPEHSVYYIRRSWVALRFSISAASCRPKFGVPMIIEFSEPLPCYFVWSYWGFAEICWLHVVVGCRWSFLGWPSSSSKWGRDSSACGWRGFPGWAAVSGSPCWSPCTPCGSEGGRESCRNWEPSSFHAAVGAPHTRPDGPRWFPHPNHQPQSLMTLYFLEGCVYLEIVSTKRNNWLTVLKYRDLWREKWRKNCLYNFGRRNTLWWICRKWIDLKPWGRTMVLILFFKLVKWISF